MQKPETKFDFKAELKKMWNALLRFLKPYKNLDKPVLTQDFEPFLKRNIQMVYTIGCVILLVFAIFALRFLPAILLVLGNWFALIVIFIILRLLCEMIAKSK